MEKPNSNGATVSLETFKGYERSDIIGCNTKVVNNGCANFVPSTIIWLTPKKNARKGQDVVRPIYQGH